MSYRQSSKKNVIKVVQNMIIKLVILDHREMPNRMLETIFEKNKNTVETFKKMILIINFIGRLRQSNIG